ncbi:MAG TPA: 2-amino-4-hydroxy-6-hydroxymethyldihydropteridine diphosphokinase [Bryobacteraceae bacterium]|nr:2-amino-4-hydroxy-6-hydroxymethyldihydropteridine diphosphokinase [Bryobacteraceae bacterium]
MPDKRVFLSLGSNLGDRRQNLDRALHLLTQNGVEIVRQSSIYETEPQDISAQPWFLNLALECRTKLFPIQLLKVLLRIERELGRERRSIKSAKGPRLIDIDLILYGHSSINCPKLTVPHPRMLQRRFVLVPLMEIDAQLRHPGSGRLLKDHLNEIRGQVVRILDD